jgi:hypothetical protein
MCLRANNSELVTGGSDGTLICWDITMGSLGRTLKTIQVMIRCRDALVAVQEQCTVATCCLHLFKLLIFLTQVVYLSMHSILFLLLVDSVTAGMTVSLI